MRLREIESFGVDLRVAPCIHEIGESGMKMSRFEETVCVPVDAFVVARGRVIGDAGTKRFLFS